jgi:putative phosphonate metabolism protein
LIVLGGGRFAIYFVPAADTVVYGFGSAVLGYDCYSGDTLAHPSGDDWGGPRWEELTREPRTYGFHATLKAPFRLLPQFDDADLLKELQALVGSIAGAPAFEPEVQILESFIAIVPRTACPAVDRLAADCVTAFDRFRAPPTPDEKARRLASGLSQRQVENLDHWGYPYVFDDFRFHMTLTGRVDPDRRTAVSAVLRRRFADCHGDRPIPVDRLALVRQERPGDRFRVVRQFMLGASR